MNEFQKMNSFVSEVGREAAIESIRTMESRVGPTNLKPNSFRGVETLVEPDVKRLMSSCMIMFENSFYLP